ncbi:MAG TPA: hypothetical protein VHU87_06095 [Rhizomicrobium sp.]|nr:hypothetical protein [Rhizomicrobium sp.]
MPGKILLGVLAAAMLVAAEPAWAGDCDALTAAIVKKIHTPHRETMLAQSPGTGAMTITMVYVGGKEYLTVSVMRTWTISTETAESKEAWYRQKTIENQETCHPDGSETIGTEVFDIVAAHSIIGAVTADERTWISRTTGLPLKADITDSDGLTTHDSWDYDAIQPPPAEDIVILPKT